MGVMILTDTEGSVFQSVVLEDKVANIDQYAKFKPSIRRIGDELEKILTNTAGSVLEPGVLVKRVRCIHQYNWFR